MKTFQKTSRFAVIITFLAPIRAGASEESIGPVGINSAGLPLPNGTPLTGDGIGIGQVEPNRPGDPKNPDGTPFDTDDFRINTSINPEGVFFTRYDNPGIPGISNGEPNSDWATFNAFVNGPLEGTLDNQVHAVEVAGVMISTDTQPLGTPAATGVSTKAKLYSIGHDATIAKEESAALMSQHIAEQNGGDIRAINMSFAIDRSVPDVLDGNALFTQFVDWSAAKHDTLYVSAGNQLMTDGTPDSTSLPTDNFNGITVARSAKEGGVYRKVSTRNYYGNDAVGPRTSIDILAPGDDILVATTQLGESTPGSRKTIESGTSLAAPHVTGTVALLQEYGDAQIAAHGVNPANAPNWGGMVTTGSSPGPTPRRHEVMKAVLMNSADKIKDDKNSSDYGKYLGMERTVLKQDGSSTWFDSDAFMELDEFGDPVPDTDTPLDEEMGTGHLNAKRALQQFLPGEHDFNGTDGFTPPVGDVPLIGWDYGTIAGANHPFNKYVLDTPLEAGDFISITLAWDRKVEFANDGGTTDEYNVDDTFQDYTDLDDVLVDLDLYLIPAGETNIGEEIAISDSRVTPVEHLFTEIPFDGDYEIWVFRNEQVAPPQDYGIAWWYGLAPDLPVANPTADFDADGDVDAADLAQWQGDFGINGDSDANNDGDSDGADFLAWQRNFGATSLSASTAVPEPTCLLLLVLGMPLLLGRRPNRFYNGGTS